MPLDFPNSPTTGDLFNGDGVTWRWDGVKWASVLNNNTSTTVPVGGSIQAAIDALPATGGEVRLSANTTYVLTSTLTISKPNVTVRAPSWGTILKRGPTLNGQVINATSSATGLLLEDFAVDGNGGIIVTATFDIEMDGIDCTANRLHVFNSGGQGGIIHAGTGRVSNSTVAGMAASGVGGAGIRVYGTNARVIVIGNTVSNTTIEGIALEGDGSIACGNMVSGCGSTLATGGGQIALYPGYATLAVGNTILQGGGTLSYGIEWNGSDQTVVGNVVINSRFHGIALNDSVTGGGLVSGNTVKNSGQSQANAHGIHIGANNSGVVITTNRVIDTQGASATQQYGIYVAAGGGDNLQVSDNVLLGNKIAAFFNGATGANRIITNNLGGVTNIPGIPGVNAANDAAAASAGVGVGGEYRNGSVRMIRIV